MNDQKTKHKHKEIKKHLEDKDEQQQKFNLNEITDYMDSVRKRDEQFLFLNKILETLNLKT